jgi:hypothetical protein
MGENEIKNNSLQVLWCHLPRMKYNNLNLKDSNYPLEWSACGQSNSSWTRKHERSGFI